MAGHVGNLNVHAHLDLQPLVRCSNSHHMVGAVLNWCVEGFLECQDLCVIGGSGIAQAMRVCCNITEQDW